ncbi:hypothetical protein EG329_007605 [Mollisiaceae sp. DMI_Dod_QoI]|nr:hypothetical protein EG329_007605 [Helotiales sp. DMI_Dod_QoI]
MLQKTWPQRIVVVQAKPGYGKTFLSSVIIQDLEWSATPLVEKGERSPTTAFFHFNSSDRFGSRRTTEALHAIATQLVHAHRKQKIAIDALCLLIDETSSGQIRASDDDVDAILKILLRQSPTFLVIDGVDEYHRYNFEDIKSFLAINLHYMTEYGMFGDKEIPSSMLDDVTIRASGTFLWAKLLVSYLNSNALTPQERHTTLANAQLLEGLDGLYNEILCMLHRCYGREKSVAADIFKWLSASLHALHTKVLHTALAIIPGSPTSKLQYLSNFPESIPNITCALVEVDHEGVVKFIHLSLKEYLESADTAKRHPEFSLFNKNEVNQYLAIRCLSYVIHDIPRSLSQLCDYRKSRLVRTLVLQLLSTKPE